MQRPVAVPVSAMAQAFEKAKPKLVTLPAYDAGSGHIEYDYSLVPSFKNGLQLGVFPSVRVVTTTYYGPGDRASMRTNIMPLNPFSEEFPLSIEEREELASQMLNKMIFAYGIPKDRMMEMLNNKYR